MRLSLTTTQFCQLIQCCIYDQLVRPDEIIPILNNQDYNDLMTLYKQRGMRTILQQYYFRLDPQMRIRHRMIDDMLRNNGKKTDAMLDIRKEKIPKAKKGIIRRTGEFLAKVMTLGMYKK